MPTHLFNREKENTVIIKLFFLYLSTESLELHEKFDNYLNYLEGVAILCTQNCIKKEELMGLWPYYFMRLRKVHTFNSNGETFCVKKDNMHRHLNSLYDGDIPDEIERLWSNEDYGKLKDPISKQEVIDPLERPIWYYINNGDYIFTPIIELVKELYKKDKNKLNLCLRNDGLN